MEKELNIAAILKNKPKGTKLWSPIFGECTFKGISCNNSCLGVDTNKRVPGIFYANGKYDENGECTIFPSKEMRDWRKFSWKKGDVLFSEDDVFIIFEEFENDAYTRFKGKHYLWKEYDEEDYSKEETKMLTSEFEKANDNDAHTYINTIEKKLGGKLNLETLEVEADVNVGDVVSDDVLYGICTKVDNSNVYCDFGCDSANYNAPITKLCLQKENINVVMTTNKEAWYKEIEKKHHISIDRNTLEVQPEFKDGDIVVYECEINDIPSIIFIFRGINQFTPYYSYYVCLSSDGFLSYKLSEFGIYNRELRFATEAEKSQLFSALAKAKKVWIPEKKQIVDLNPKVELKPFDKVLVRDFKDQAWEVSLFGYKDANNYYCCNGSCWNQCIPYIGNESLLGTTKNVEG